MRYIKGKIDRNQVSMEPMCFDELIVEENPVRVIDAFVEMLDIKALKCTYSEPNNNTVGMVNKLIKSVIKDVERNDNPFFFVHKTHCALQKLHPSFKMVFNKD